MKKLYIWGFTDTLIDELIKTDEEIHFASISELITHKILERELKKVLIRTYFKEKEL